MVPEEIAAIRSDLESLNERLSDISIDLLHRAMDDPDPKASVHARTERLVTRARRSIEKASVLLGEVPLADGA